MDNKVKSCVLFLFLLFLILTTKNNVAFVTLITLSLTTIFYNLNKGVSIYLVLGFTGIYLATLVRQSRETFQNVTSAATYTPTLKCSGEEEEEQTIELTLKNFKELGFVFNALFQMGETEMRKILKKYCIEDLFGLKNYIEYYRNQADSEIDTTSWAYSEKAQTLSKLVPIYTLTPEDMVTLINREKITYTQLEKDKVLRSRIFGIDSLTNLAMEYYFNDKKLTKKHYKIITTLGMDNLLPEAIKDNWRRRRFVLKK